MRCRPWARCILLTAVVCLVLAGGLGGGAWAQETGENGGEEPVSTARGLQQQIDAFFGTIVGHMAKVLFFTLGDPGQFFGGANGLPLIIIVLVSGGLFFTFRYGWVNVILFRHAIDVVRGRFDKPEDKGEISHFQALTSALAATVGLGNIAGVALAITAGGPGAVFWMWVTAVFGMSMKFSSCTLAQLYRRIKRDEHVLGGPMVYLEDGLRTLLPKSLGWLPFVLSVPFAILTIFAAFGGGNMFQANQVWASSAKTLDLEQALWFKVFMGVALSIMVGLVVIGGIRRIGRVTSRLVPIMCAGYVVCCIIIIGINYKICSCAAQPFTFTSHSLIDVIPLKRFFGKMPSVGSNSQTHDL